MTKILITGYKHSGTTMLMQLLRSHPQVGWIEFEESYIEVDKPKEWVVMMAQQRVPNLKKFAWGEKIPWGNRSNGKKAERAISFSKKWLKFFEKDARILHILRHPLDVAFSGRSYENYPKDTIKSIFNSLPFYTDFLNNSTRNTTVIYEDLTRNPSEYLSKIFEFLKLNYDEKTVKKVISSDLKFGKINSDRAFAFERNGVKSDIDYDEIIRKVKNKI